MYMMLYTVPLEKGRGSSYDLFSFQKFNLTQVTNECLAYKSLGDMYPFALLLLRRVWRNLCMIIGSCLFYIVLAQESQTNEQKRFEKDSPSVIVQTETAQIENTCYFPSASPIWPSEHKFPGEGLGLSKQELESEASPVTRWERRTLGMTFSAAVPTLSHSSYAAWGQSNCSSTAPLQESGCRPSTAAQGTCWTSMGTPSGVCSLEPPLQPSGQRLGTQVLCLWQSKLVSLLSNIWDEFSLWGMCKVRERESVFMTYTYV